MEQESGLGLETSLGFEEAVFNTRVALRAHGFSILSEMPAPVDVSDGLGRRHLFMTVWQQSISTGNLGVPGLDVGDHFPCSVAVYEENQSGATFIAAFDPVEELAGTGAESSGDLAAAALKAALAAAAQPG